MNNILRLCLSVILCFVFAERHPAAAGSVTLGSDKSRGNDAQPANKDQPAVKPAPDPKEKAKWVNELINKLHSSDLWVRVEAIKKLGDTEDSKALPSLKQALGDESIDINVEALRALKKIGREEIKKGNDESFKLLLRGIILYNMQSLRFYALDGAASIDAEKTRKYLMNNLKSYFPDTQGRAAEGLANLFLVTDLRDKNTVQELIDALSQNSEGKQQDKINDALKTITRGLLEQSDLQPSVPGRKSLHSNGQST
ncbi:MAG: HEAT repeat domain-containing protein [Planctomycetota bacterium]